MLTIKYQAAFKKDYKRIVKRGYDMRLLEKVIELLANQKPLPEKNRDHQLSGDYAGCRECHITPDNIFDFQGTTIKTPNHFTTVGVWCTLTKVKLYCKLFRR